MGLKESGLRGSLRNVSVGIDAIPDSVVLQYFATEVNGGSSTWPDDVETQDMGLTGGETDATLSDGSESLEFDGANDTGDIPVPSNFDEDGMHEWTLEIAFEFDFTGDNEDLINTRESDGQQFLLSPNRDENNATDDGNMGFRFDDGTDRFRFSFQDNPNLNDGNRHDLTLIMNDMTRNDATLILDGDEKSITTNETEGPDSWSAWSLPFQIAARNNDGSIDRHMPVEIGAMRWHDEAIEGQTIDDAYPP